MTFEQWWDSVEWSFSLRLIVKPLVKPFAKMAWNVATLKEREECANLCYKDDRNNAFVNRYNGKRLDLLCSELIRARGQE